MGDVRLERTLEDVLSIFPLRWDSRPYGAPGVIRTLTVFFLKEMPPAMLGYRRKNWWVQFDSNKHSPRRIRFTGGRREPYRTLHPKNIGGSGRNPTDA